MATSSSKNSRFRRREFLQGSAALAGAALVGALPTRTRAATKTEIVFASAPFFSADSIQKLMDAYNGSQNAVHATYLALPSAADGVALQKRLYDVLKQPTGAPDVFSMDLVRVGEVAAAGLALPLDKDFGADQMKEFFPGIVAGCTASGQLMAMPWFADCGMLFSRKDMLEKIGVGVPKTWDDLVAAAAKGVGGSTPHGFLWQGKRSEAFVCNLVSVLGSNGASILSPDGATVTIADPAAVAAMQFLYDSIHRTHVSPADVLSWDEEPCRQPFNDGEAMFLRNWSYTWGLAQQPSSAIAGKISVAPLPHFQGKRSAACLGGFQFGVNAHSKQRSAAVDFLHWLSSRETQLRFATVDGLAPTRPSVFDDPSLAKAQPFLAQLKQVFVGAIARPVTPKYPAITKVLQSTARQGLVSGNIAEALASAKTQIEALLAA